MKYYKVKTDYLVEHGQNTHYDLIMTGHTLSNLDIAGETDAYPSNLKPGTLITLFDEEKGFSIVYEILALCCEEPQKQNYQAGASGRTMLQSYDVSYIVSPKYIKGKNG